MEAAPCFSSVNSVPSVVKTAFMPLKPPVDSFVGKVCAGVYGMPVVKGGQLLCSCDTICG